MFRFTVYPARGDRPVKVGWYEYSEVGLPPLRGSPSSTLEEFKEVIRGDERARCQLEHELFVMARREAGEYDK
jgi:hypothetical protein